MTRGWPLVLALALTCCGREPSVGIHAQAVRLDVETVVLDDTSWSTRGILELSLARDHAAVDATQVVLSSFSLDACAPNALLPAKVRDGTLQLTSEPAMPLSLEAGDTTNLTISFDASGVPTLGWSSWDLWCISPTESLCPLDDGQASLRIDAALEDSWSREHGGYSVGTSVGTSARPALDDRRSQPALPPAATVGTTWSRTLPDVESLLALSIDELGRMSVLVRDGGPTAKLLALDEGGNLRWSLPLPATFPLDVSDPPTALSAHGGRVALAGSFRAPATVDSVPLLPVGGDDVFVLVLDATDGHLLWARALGDTEDQQLVAAELDATGELALAASDTGSTDWGGGPVGGGPGFALVRLDTNGNHISSRRVGNGFGDIGVDALALDAQGRAVLGGELNTPVDFGGGVLTPVTGEATLWLASYDAAGNHAFSHRLSADGRLAAIERNPTGSLYAAVSTLPHVHVIELDANGIELGMRSAEALPTSHRAFAVGPSGFAALLGSGDGVTQLHVSQPDGFAAHTVACWGAGAWLLATGPAGDIGIAGEYVRYAAFDQGALEAGNSAYAPGVVIARIAP